VREGLGFAPELEVLGGCNDDTWLRCRACGRFFWSTDDSSKYQFQGDWEIPTELARAALIEHDPRALARMFVSLNLPFGPVWELTSALVEILRHLTPAISDAQRAEAIEAAGPHARWSAAARLFRREAEKRPFAAEMTFPIDLRVPSRTIREWYEVGDALVLLTDGAELLRFEPRGLVQVPLSARPEYLASGNARLVLRVGDAMIVLDDLGNATSWPLAGAYDVLELDDAWWLFVPREGEERFVELRFPDGQPRAKFRRRFGATERFMQRPRRFAGGWIFSNLTDDDGATQALTLFDAELRTIAFSDEKTPPGDRAVVPIDERSFWAIAPKHVERWVRAEGKRLECVDRFAARIAWSHGSLFLSATPRGVVTARERDGSVRFTYDTKATGALYAVEAYRGIFLYDDRRAHLLDDYGRVQATFEIESASVRRTRHGIVYVKSLADLWVVSTGEPKRVHVGMGARLEATCGDDALLRYDDGTCLVVSSWDGSLGRFSAPAASFSVVGTRGGPWVIEGDRIRGAFGKNAHVLAEAIAVGSGALSRRIPSRDEGATWAVVLADGRVPVVVQEYPRGAIRVFRFPGSSWNPTRDEHTKVALEASAYVKDWAARPADVPTVPEMALAVAEMLRADLGERFLVSIPGAPEATEMSVAPERSASAHIGVFAGKLVAWPDVVSIATRADLAGKRAEIVAAVRKQKERYEKNVVLAARVRALADALVRRLSERLGEPLRAWPYGAPSYDGVPSATIARGQKKAVEVTAADGVLHVHAGAPGALGFDADGDDVDSMLEPIAAALSRERGVLTLDRLVEGRRYRVRESIQGLHAGATVTFTRYDDVDNHYGEYVFVDESGHEVKVVGDFSTPERSPLGETYRFLEEVAG